MLGGWEGGGVRKDDIYNAGLYAGFEKAVKGL